MKRILCVLLCALLLCSLAAPAFAQTDKAVALNQVLGLKAKTATSGGKLTLSWKKVSGAVGYEVYRRAPGETEYSLFTTVKRNKVTIKGHATGAEYLYKLRAYALDGTATVYGDFSEPFDAFFVKKPATLKLVRGTERITVHYSVPDGALKLQIYMKGPKDSDYKLIKTISASSDGEKFLVKNLSDAGNYSFKARAYWKLGSKKFYTSYSKIKTTTLKTK